MKNCTHISFVMKKLLLFIFLLVPMMAIAQDDLGFNFQDVAIVASDYEAASKAFDLEKKETLHAVRGYIEAKENQLSDVQKKIEIVNYDRSANIVDTIAGQQYLDLVDSSDPTSVISDKMKRYLTLLGYMPQFYGDRKIGDLDVITEKTRRKVVCIKKDYAMMQILHTSRKNLEDDINKAQLRIDSLYGKLYDEGNFKTWITGFFSFIVAALLLTFFVFISRKSETSLAKDFLSSGNGLQFITLFSLVIAIILFGVLGILEGRELAAILSGISGYILGKGIQNPRSSNPNNETNPSNEATTNNGGAPNNGASQQPVEIMPSAENQEA